MLDDGRIRIRTNNDGSGRSKIKRILRGTDLDPDRQNWNKQRDCRLAVWNAHNSNILTATVCMRVCIGGHSIKADHKLSLLFLVGWFCLRRFIFMATPSKEKIVSISSLWQNISSHSYVNNNNLPTVPALQNQEHRLPVHPGTVYTTQLFVLTKGSRRYTCRQNSNKKFLRFLGTLSYLSQVSETVRTVYICVIGQTLPATHCLYWVSVWLPQVISDLYKIREVLNVRQNFSSQSPHPSSQPRTVPYCTVYRTFFTVSFFRCQQRP